MMAPIQLYLNRSIQISIIKLRGTVQGTAREEDVCTDVILGAG